MPPLKDAILPAPLNRVPLGKFNRAHSKGRGILCKESKPIELGAYPG